MPQRHGFFLSLCAGLALSACASAGPYNHARSYEPLGDEEEHYDATRTPVSLEDVKRDPNGFRNTELAWFGVVTGMGDVSNGKTRVELSLRAHQQRHLCGDDREDSCRLTVSERDLGKFSVDLSLSPDAQQGKDRVWFGSLLHVYGKPTGDYDDEGGPILSATYYRHFPRGSYVTTASKSAMRR